MIRLTGSSSFLPVSVRGIAGTATISSGRCLGERLVRSASAIRLSQRVVEGDAVAEDDEQEQVVRLLEVDDEAVEHLVELLDDAVELARPEPHAATVQRRVGTAGDHAAPALREQDPVAVPPDARIVLEVGRAVAGAVGVVPEAHRHGGHRTPDHELAELPDHGPAVEVEGDGVDAETRGGDLPRVDGQDRVARQQARADVRAAAPDVEEEVGPELLVQPRIALGRERRTGLAHGPDRREVEAATRLEPVLAAGHREGGAETHERRPGLLGELPLEGEVGKPGVAVDHDDRRAEEQVRHERVPHHPRGRREPEQPVAVPDVEAEAQVLAVLEEDATVPVDDRLRQAGRAGREEHVERVRERDGVELERPGLGEQLLPGERVRQRVVGAARVRHVDDVLERRYPRADRGHLLAAVDEPLAPAVAGDRQQDRRLELAQPVEDAARPELGGARRPDRTEACGREEGDERLGDVREIRDDPVAGPDTESLEPRPRPCHLLPQLAEGQLERTTRLRAREDRDRVDVLVSPQRRAPRSSAARPGTTPPRACRRMPAPARTACAPGPRRSPRASPRSPRDP